MSLYSNFRGFPKSIGEIPTSYKDSISYEEQILWLCNFIEKEILPQIDISQETVAKIEASFEELENEVESKLATFGTNINEVKVYSDAQNELLKVYLLGLINSLDQRFDNIPDSLLVFNPTNGMQNDLNKTLNDIYSQTRTGALTASEYDALELTATSYDNEELTATDYDTNGKEELAS